MRRGNEIIALTRAKIEMKRKEINALTHVKVETKGKEIHTSTSAFHVLEPFKLTPYLSAQP
jgi:hypothetical protein